MICQLLRNDGTKRREDDPWDVFIPEDEWDPEPEPGDFWTDDDSPVTDAASFARQCRFDSREVLSCSP